MLGSFLSPPPPKKKQKTHPQNKTLARWARQQHIHSILLPGGTQRHYRLYDVSSVVAGGRTVETVQAAEVGIAADANAAIYARDQGADHHTPADTVSTRKQAGDLDRQIEHLRARHPGVPVYRDLASGLNFHRPALRRLLENALAGRVHTVYIAHRDRLCRFADRPRARVNNAV